MWYWLRREGQCQLLGPLMLVLAACADSGPDYLDGYVGTWTLEVEAKDGCWPAFNLIFEVTQEDVDRSGEYPLGLYDYWWLASTPTDRRSYSGQITNAQRFSFAFYLDQPSESLLDFSGTNPTPTGLTGILGNLSGLFPDGCSAPAHASK